MSIWKVSVALIVFVIVAAQFMNSPKCIMNFVVDSGDITDEPFAFQFALDGKLFGAPVNPLGKKPYRYEMQIDGTDIKAGPHVLSGHLWYPDGTKKWTHGEKITIIKQGVCRYAHRN